MKLRELPKLIGYGLVNFLEISNEIIIELRKPKTWMQIMYILILYGLFTKQINIIVYGAPAMVVIYYIRLSIDGKYRKVWFESDIKKGKKTYIVQEYYNSYEKECQVKNQVPLLIDNWIEEKRKNLYE